MQGLRVSDNCAIGYLQLSTKNEVSKENGYLVSLGCQVVELARFVSVLPLYVNRVLSSAAKLLQGQLSLGFSMPVSWCHGGLLSSWPLLQAEVWLS